MFKFLSINCISNLNSSTVTHTCDIRSWFDNLIFLQNGYLGLQDTVKHRQFPWPILCHLIGYMFNMIGSSTAASAYDVQPSIGCPFFNDVGGFVGLLIILAKS